VPRVVVSFSGLDSAVSSIFIATCLCVPTTYGPGVLGHSSILLNAKEACRLEKEIHIFLSVGGKLISISSIMIGEIDG
jgi:hypothetical protein